MRDEFMIARGGKQYVLYVGLLDEAHNVGLRRIDTAIVQIPNAGNSHVAIVKATVEMNDGRTFSGLGDASPENLERNQRVHALRFAETRAKARALRDATNIGAAALEDLGAPGPQLANSQDPTPQRANHRRTRRKSKPNTVNAPRTTQHRVTQPGEGHHAKPASRRARQSQIDLLRTLATERAGSSGPDRLAKTIAKPLPDLTVEEATNWINRLDSNHSAAPATGYASTGEA